jgi:hypothetical protein
MTLVMASSRRHVTFCMALFGDLTEGHMMESLKHELVLAKHHGTKGDTLPSDMAMQREDRNEPHDASAHTCTRRTT